MVTLMNVAKSPATANLGIDRSTIVHIVRRWGNSASDAILDPACQIFMIPGVEGLIGYRMDSGCAVVYGDPICSPDNIVALVQAFHDYCQKQDRRIIYIGTSEAFTKWAMTSVCKASIEFGDDYFLDPHSDDPRRGPKGSLVRRKVRHALREGASVKEYLENNEVLEQSIEQVGASWLKARHGPQIFISHVRLFENRMGKRWFYAEHNGKVVGVLLLNQLQKHQGWLLNHLMFTPDAPHGTQELLIVTAFETLHEEDCRYLTFGIVPGREIGKVIGLNRISAWIARKLFKVANRFFHLDGHRIFWEKFQPQNEPTYLLFSHSNLGLKEVSSLKQATNVAF